MNINVGIKGEVRVVKINQATGEVIEDTGFQPNIILNNGLEFFGGNNGSDLMYYCVIGTGNSTPQKTQTGLDVLVAGVQFTGIPTDIITKIDYDETKDGLLYKTSKTKKYSFTNLNNVNVTEVGLAAQYTANNPANNYICTRALIKGTNGSPTAITVKTGEQLDIYYRLWQVYDLTDKTGTINLLDGNGGSIPYNYVLRMAGVGSISDYGTIIGLPLQGRSGNNYPNTFSGELGTIKTKPSGELSSYFNQEGQLQTYQLGSYKRTGVWNYSISQMNGDIRSFLFYTSMGFYQIRYGSVTGDNKIVKTNTQTLSIPFEISWGRYEGAL